MMWRPPCPASAISASPSARLTATAGIAGYYTPVGRFAISRKVPGYDPSPLGVLYKPMYFYGGYAIHGNPSVPPYPASHGCIRVPNFVADRLYESEPVLPPVLRRRSTGNSLDAPQPLGHARFLTLRSQLHDAQLTQADHKRVAIG